MNLDEMAKLIRERFPEKATDISKTLDLLSNNLQEIRSEIVESTFIFREFFGHDAHAALQSHKKIEKAILEYMGIIEVIQTTLEGEHHSPVRTLKYSQPNPEAVNKLLKLMREREQKEKLNRS